MDGVNHNGSDTAATTGEQLLAQLRAVPEIMAPGGPIRLEHRLQLEEFYRQHAPAIYRRCRHILGVDAEDAVQEVFLRVAANLDKAPRSTEAGFWIHRIATNYCLNEVRATRRRPTVQATPSPADRGDCTADVIVARDFVRHLLSRAPDQVAAAAWLHYVDGMTQEEVAGALRLSRRTVSAYLAKIRTRASETSCVERQTASLGRQKW